MCHFAVELDQSTRPIARVLDAVEHGGFYLRSVRLVPSACERRADVYFSLGGGSGSDFDALIATVRQLPGVLSTQSTTPPSLVD